MSGEITDYGFTFGAAEVTRMIEVDSGVMIRVSTGHLPRGGWRNMEQSAGRSRNLERSTA